MTTVKGWDSLYTEGEEDRSGFKPLPGTDAYLAWVAEKKKREKEETKKTESPPLPSDDKDQTGILRGTDTPRIPDQTISHEIEITSNYMRFDLDIFDMLRSLSEGELRIYLDLIRRTYGHSPPQNTCSVTRRQVGETAGVGSPNAQVSIIQRLEDKGLVKRLNTSKGKHQQSVFRVYLPCELPPTTSLTVLWRVPVGSAFDATDRPDGFGSVSR